MKKTSILSAILAGSLMVFGGFGCSHNDQPPAGPNTVSGQATPTTTTGDQTTTPQSTTGDQTTQPGTQSTTPSTTGSTPTTPGYQSTTPNSGYQPTTPNSGSMDQRQPVKGTMDKSGNMPNSPSDTTKPDTTNPDTTTPPSSTTPPH